MVDERVTHNTQGKRIPVLGLGFILGGYGIVKLGHSHIGDGIKTTGPLGWSFAALCRNFLLLADTTGTGRLGDAREALVVITRRGIVLNLDILNALVWLVGALFLVYRKLTTAIVLNRLTGGVFAVSKQGTLLERSRWCVGGGNGRIII